MPSVPCLREGWWMRCRRRVLSTGWSLQKPAALFPLFPASLQETFNFRVALMRMRATL